MNYSSTALSDVRQRDGHFVVRGRSNTSLRRAFTLVEIMVSVTILSLMMLFLFSVFNLASQAWQNSEKKVDAFREARAALYVIKRDLSGLQVNTNLPMALNKGVVLNLATLQNPADQLFFMSTLSASSQGGTASGETCGVGYYVGWGTNSFQNDSANFAKQSYNLFRYFRSSDTNYFNLTNFWASSGDIGKLYKDASTLPQNGDEVLARNVIGFRVKPYYWQNVVTVVGGITNTNAVLFSANTDPPQASLTITNSPAFLDISMTVVNYATAGQLGNSTTDWNNRIAEPSPRSIVNQSKQEFYIRIPLAP